MRRLACIPYVLAVLVPFGGVLVVACSSSDDTNGAGASSSGKTSSSTSGDIGGSSSSSGGRSSSSSGGSGLSLAGYATAICEKVQTCQPAAFSESWAFKAECIGDVEASNQSGVSALPGSKVTQDQIDACAAKIAATSCAFGLNDLEPCVLKGTLPSTTPCYDGRQCQSGRCKRTNLANDCGTCAAFETVDGACLEDADCAFGLTCIDAKCAKLGAKGEACTIDGKRCDAGLVCANGHCADAVDKDGACTPSGNECRRGLFCDVDKCHDVTEKIAALGEVCDSSTKCRKSSCRNGKCVALATAGDACSDQPTGAADCDGESYCVNGKCEANTYPDCR